jgi:hypothetical protein
MTNVRSAGPTATADNPRMGRPAAVVRMTYAEYLAAEAVAEVRHEYFGGDVWAMAGGTIEHGGLAVAVAREIGLAPQGVPRALGSGLGRGRPCLFRCAPPAYNSTSRPKSRFTHVVHSSSVTAA